MVQMNNKNQLWLAISTLLQLPILFKSAWSQPFIGINYGEVADNLPPPASTAKLLQSTTIARLRLYGVNPAIIQSLAHTGISIIITTSNADIPSLAADPSAAAAWVAANVLPFHPSSTISTISVGNEVFLTNDPNLISQLLPAMTNLHAALAAQSLDTQIKISTVHPMSILQQSDPPSSAIVDPAIADTMKPIVSFLQQTGGTFMVNPYPFFAYQSDPRPETLAFCLFQPNQGRLDSGSGIVYTNMFDAQVDAVRSALKKMGFGDVEIVVAETGWPYRGDPGEAGASLENARSYNGNLVAHLRSMVGTPIVPGKSVDTYLFALYDEDLKPGPTSERSFGIYKPDLTMSYDIGLAKSTPPKATSSPRTPVAQTSVPAPPVAQTSGPAPPAPQTSGSAPSTPKLGKWCMPKAGVSNEQLQANIDYVCGQAGVDCREIHPAGGCYQPDTVASHAAYAINLLYQSSGKHPWSCDFMQTATVTYKDPSSFYTLPQPPPPQPWLCCSIYAFIELINLTVFVVLIWCSSISCFILS